MVCWKVVAAVGFSALFGITVARAGDSIDPVASGSELTLQRPLYMADEPAKKPLAELLDRWGMGQEKTGFNVYGFVEGSITYGFDRSPGDFIAGRVFDVDDKEVLLNQVDLSVEKTVDSAEAAKNSKWLWGGKMEWLFGADSRFIHANGLNFYGGASPQLSPENQIDLTQVYVDLGVPVGNGLLVRAGKMVTHMGYETINPTTDPLYSHSYLFGYAIPFTHTGVMAFYTVNDKMTVMGGFSRGWEQSLVDNNDDLDYLGQVKYVFNDKTTGYFNVVTGPEQPGNNSLWRTVFDLILSYQATDSLLVAANGDFGFEPGASPAGGSAQWYGVALYGSYKLSPSATLNVRGEWFEDPQGARGLGGNEYEVTVGVGIKPFPNDKYGQNLLLRPEIRYDYSENSIFGGGTDHDQWTAAVDAIFTF